MAIRAADEDINRLVDPPDRDDPEPSASSCVPYGAAIVETKPYWYIVENEDLGAFWQIPIKFNLPAQKGTAWTWQELRNANLDWPGGFAKVNDACMLQGLYAGAKLHVPADWPEPRPGVRTETKKGPGGLPSGSMTTALIVGAIGIAGIGVLAYVARKQQQ